MLRQEREEDTDANKFVLILFPSVIFAIIIILNITLCDAAGFCMLKDQKNLQGQLIAEREALYRSKPSPSKPLGGKKAHGMSILLGSRGIHQTPKLTRNQISVRSMELYQLVILSLTINRN